MNYRIFQNLTRAPKYASCAHEAGGYVAGNENPAGANGLLLRLRTWLARIDCNRRIEHENARAIEHLQGLTDTQLRDIGITRPDIERAVRFGRDGV